MNGDWGIAGTTQFLPAALFETGNALASSGAVLGKERKHLSPGRIKDKAVAKIKDKANAKVKDKAVASRGGQYVLIIHFYVESGQKIIQFNIQFKIQSKIFIQ